MLAIQVSQVSKSFHHYEVLKEVTFEVAQGTCFALFGPNGAGKTTLLRILATLQRPTSGWFKIGGYHGIGERGKVRELLFMIAHGSYLYDDLNAVENIRFAMSLRGGHSTDRETKAALDRVGIGPFADLKVRFFSAGMKKRLSMAKAILTRPRVLLLDEPYSSLDEQGVKMVNGSLRELAGEGSTVVMTTHDRANSAAVANRAGILRKGVLRELTVNELTAADALF
ncbi:MAG TPA: heme ABC exporter ATP-binding protein CcmA [Nitrospiria bacterium]|nr:heme ABC exporter ATP-binding protein CcmA [Nitrospiria bacterium]